MLVTITNIATVQVFVSTIYTTIEVSGSVTMSRTLADMDRDLQLKQLVVDGLVSLTYSKEATDINVSGWSNVAHTYSNLTRPLPTAVPAKTYIYNSDDNAFNVSDGTNWRDMAGNLT